ncbi:class I SAM-dependent methyltransferase [Nocardioides sp. JQ2195]|uniref:class I SAM-dependent methyltransferase n=1 Tax=Nocardioides sp. JQ2195 TaxID=2592334 RepID=UPI00143E3520|nr:methyltransferase domain-containing protein [Nocardioides sp. JQ2195]QIX26663.1 class I SAM-dependent methyltransferase [Nocardioides sp. JQ2195]
MNVPPGDLDAVRESYDRVADNYVDLLQTQGMGDVRTHPWLKGCVDAFATQVRGLGPVLDVGCGPGQVTAYLRDLGVEASGVDLSPRMVEHARRLHPDCSFAVAAATELDLEPESLGGILGWWSLFNLPRELLPSVLTSFHDALVPGGEVLVATHVGDDDVPRTEAYGGVPVSWTTHRWQPDQLATLLEQAGFTLVAELRLPADGQQGPGVVLAGRR